MRRPTEWHDIPHPNRQPKPDGISNLGRNIQSEIIVPDRSEKEQNNVIENWTLWIMPPRAALGSWQLCGLSIYYQVIILVVLIGTRRQEELSAAHLDEADVRCWTDLTRDRLNEGGGAVCVPRCHFEEERLPADKIETRKRKRTGRKEYMIPTSQFLLYHHCTTRCRGTAPLYGALYRNLVR